MIPQQRRHLTVNNRYWRGLTYAELRTLREFAFGTKAVRVEDVRAILRRMVA